jgi:hypothetical protein
MDGRTRPSPETHAAEDDDAQRPPGADRMPSEEEERRADEQPLDPSVSEHEREMTARGADQRGEGRLP